MNPPESDNSVAGVVLEGGTDPRRDLGESSQLGAGGAAKSDDAVTGAPGAALDAGDEPADDAGEADPEPLTPEAEEAARAAAVGRAPNGSRSYDWPTIKKRYCEGVPDRDNGVTIWPSLAEVAAYYGASHARVREKSAIEGWVEERNKYQAFIEQRRRSAKAAAMSKEAVNLDGRALDAAKMGLQLCMSRLAELGQQAQQRRAQTVGSGVADSGIDAQEQQRLAQAVDLWHKVGLRAVGDPETHRVEITGANGAPIEIAQELKRDDPSRIAGVLSVLASAGLGDLFGGPDAGGPVAVDRGADGHPAAVEARR